MSRNKYLMIMASEWLLLTILSICTLIPLAEGFFIPDEWSGTLFPALPLCGIFCAYWVTVTYNKKSSKIGAGIFLAGTAILILILLSSDEAAREGLLYLLITVVCTTLIFAASRTRLGAAVLVVTGCIIICGNLFFQYGSHPVLLCMNMPAAAILLIERNYRIRIRHISTRSPAVMRTTGAGALCCLLAMAMAGLSMCVIIPAGLPTHEMKLIEELVRMPIMEKIGTASIISLMDPDSFTDDTNEENSPTDQDGENTTDMQTTEQDDASEDQEKLEEEDLINSGQVGNANGIRYQTGKVSLILSPFLLAGAVAGIILLKKRQRKSRLERFDGLEKESRVSGYYQYYLHMLSLISLGDGISDTVREYDRRIAGKAVVLFPEEEEFSRLSRDFELVYYGGVDLDENEWALFRKTAEALPERCCRTVGKLRYLLLFFRT